MALHHGDGVEHLGRHGTGVGHPVLAGTRQAPHPAAKPHTGQHNQHQHRDDLDHQPRPHPHQHEQSTRAHHRIAQAHGQRRADHGLHQGGVGAQSRQHLAGLGGFKKRGALLQHMGVDGLSHIGGDALAQPAHHIKARRRKNGQGHRHREKPKKVGGQALCISLGTSGQAAVDEFAQRPWKCQGRRRRQQ